MPLITVVIPEAMVPADRLTLGATDARAISVSPTTSMCTGFNSVCMAEE